MELKYANKERTEMVEHFDEEVPPESDCWRQIRKCEAGGAVAEIEPTLASKPILIPTKESSRGW